MTGALEKTHCFIKNYIVIVCSGYCQREYTDNIVTRQWCFGNSTTK